MNIRALEDRLYSKKKEDQVVLAPQGSEGLRYKVSTKEDTACGKVAVWVDAGTSDSTRYILGYREVSV